MAEARGEAAAPATDRSPDGAASGADAFGGVPAYTLAQLGAYFLKLGTIGFGGPVALIEYMHRDLVEKRGWISESDYRDGLALSQLARARSPHSSRSISATYTTAWWAPRSRVSPSSSPPS
jgi:hypothetical protein